MNRTILPNGNLEISLDPRRRQGHLRHAMEPTMNESTRNGDTMTVRETACQVVNAAGQAGGSDEIRKIADRGWPADCWTEGQGEGQPYTAEERAAIQKRAREVVAEFTLTLTVTVETMVDPGWIEFVTGGPEGYGDIFMNNGHCGYWLLGVAHHKTRGWLAFDFAAEDVDRPKESETKRAIAAWKAGKPLPKHWHRLDVELAKKSWEEGFKRSGAEWYENGDGDTYDNAVQRALFKGEVVYG